MDAPPRARGSVGLATVYLKNGHISVSKLALSSQGNVVKKLPFSSSRVKAIEVTMANAGTHYTCWNDSQGTYSCSGTSKDDNLKFSIRGTAVR